MRQLVVCVLLLVLAATPFAEGQNGSSTTNQSGPAASPSPDPDVEHPASAVPTRFISNVLVDQKEIWTSPFKARIQDMNWLVPMIGLTAGMINADAELSSRVDVNGTLGSHASTLANGGLAAALGGAGGLYLLGKFRSDDHEREAGILGVEAATNGLIVTEALKVVTRR
ncbi:MAG TPA: hypothetical protein VFI72_08555, partial [Candidatus Angelobacter sp.]|nr:hypothetical protein [Candidatus Angelobacter sp.]